MNQEKIAKYECDDYPTHDPEQQALYVYFAGNMDWYATIGPHRADGGLAIGPSVRFSTSGGRHSTQAILALAILHDLGVDDKDTALWRARALVKQLREDQAFA